MTELKRTLKLSLSIMKDTQRGSRKNESLVVSSCLPVQIERSNKRERERRREREREREMRRERERER